MENLREKIMDQIDAKKGTVQSQIFLRKNLAYFDLQNTGEMTKDQLIRAFAKMGLSLEQKEQSSLVEQLKDKDSGLMLISGIIEFLLGKVKTNKVVSMNELERDQKCSELRKIFKDHGFLLLVSKAYETNQNNQEAFETLIKEI